MQQPLVSIIMSVYNETIAELSQSIFSILHQTYANIEFIIINDNPDNRILSPFLHSITDKRVRIYSNTSNTGLVASLNRALTYIHGDYIARMDADDISLPDRIEKQMKYLECHSLDMIGAYMRLIDENGLIIQEEMRFPMREKDISRYMPWGNCIPHPTWLVKRCVYEDMHGYRNIPNCEDYDFILRVIAAGKYRLGNMPDIGILYRLRNTGISKSNAVNQYILRMYISKNRKKIETLTEEEILAYRNSISFEEEKARYESFLMEKTELKNSKQIGRAIKIIFNRYFYFYLTERICMVLRERG